MFITLTKNIPQLDCDLGTIPTACLAEEIQDYLIEHSLYSKNVTIDSNDYNLFIYINGDRICVNYKSI